MVSNDLEKSLRDDIGRHLDERVSGLQQEVARLQTQVDDAFARFAERLGDMGEASAAIAASVSEHLHTAFTEGIEEAATKSVRARAASDVALIKAALDDIDNQRTQTDILSALVNRAASFAPRIAFFIIKNNRATGWRARGLEGTIGDDAVREISLPLEARTLLGEIVESKQTWSGAANAHDQNAEIYRRLGGDTAPERLVAVPLVARNKTVAALYADSADLDAEAINLEAIETLVRVAGMAVELLATQRPAPTMTRTPPAPQPFVPPPPSVAPASRHTSTQPFTHTPPLPAPGATDDLNASDNANDASETASSFDAASQSSFDAMPPAPSAVVDDGMTNPQEQDFAAQDSAETSVATTGEFDAASPAPYSDATGDNGEASPTEAAHAPTPLGARRAYGRGAAADLPIEVTDEEEKRLHNDARRYARLLVSEIKLYNEQKVRDGRTEGGIYPRLREEIDRSREMYDKRVRPEVAARYDYFHTEIVNTLAEGDPAKLGDGYPGTTAAAT